jgi:ribose transport system permease protein
MRLWLARNNGALFALVLFIAMFSIYVVKNGVGLKVGLVTAVANKGVLLALVAMAQTLPILTSGLDLSVGMIFVLTNCIASALLNGPPWLIGVGIAAVLLSGAACGAINGALVVYGRLQPIIATLATSAVYYGLALIIRPVPGGSVEPTFARALTSQIFGVIPTTLVILLAVVLVVWVPFQLSTTGRGCYAIGSSSSAAYMTGIAVRRSRLAAYTLGGLLASIAGLLLSAMTLSGHASATSGGTYTLSSIAAVVICCSFLTSSHSCSPLFRDLSCSARSAWVRYASCARRIDSNSLVSADDACSGGRGSPGSHCIRLHRRPVNPRRDV